MNLPENENLGKAVNEAMKGIEEANEDLRGVLPQDYTSLSEKVAENTPKRLLSYYIGIRIGTKQSQNLLTNDIFKISSYCMKIFLNILMKMI